MTCALPLARLPMLAIQEEIKSSYRMQVSRIADLAFSEFKEKIYNEQIPWKDLAHSKKEKTILPESTVVLQFKPIGFKKFIRQTSFYSVGKKGKNGEEWRLVTYCVKFKPTHGKLNFLRSKSKHKNIATFEYQVILEKRSASTAPSPPIDTPDSV